MPMSDTLRIVTRRSVLVLGVAFFVSQRSPAKAEFPAILVHKDPNCSCCAGWVRHLKDAGFAVRVEETTNLQPVRKRLGVPADLSACHTAEIVGYVLEGNVPPTAGGRCREHLPTAG